MPPDMPHPEWSPARFTEQERPHKAFLSCIIRKDHNGAIEAFRQMKHEERNNALALETIKNGGASVVRELIEEFHGLDKAMAHELARAGSADIVLMRPDLFAGLELDADMAVATLDSGLLGYFLAYRHRFSGLNSAVATRLMKQRAGEELFAQPDAFPGLVLDSDVALAAINSVVYRDDVLRHIEKFSSLRGEVAMALVLSQRGDAAGLKRFFRAHGEKFEQCTSEDLEWLLEQRETLQTLDEQKELDRDFADRVIAIDPYLFFTHVKSFAPMKRAFPLELSSSIDRAEEDLVGGWRFDDLDALLRITHRSAPIAESRYAKKELTALLDQGAPLSAKKLLDILQRDGEDFGIDPTLSQRIEAAAHEEVRRREQREPLRSMEHPEYLPKDATTVAAHFYLYERLDLLASSLWQELYRQPDGMVPVATRRALADLRRELAVRLGGIRQELQKYVTYATYAEFALQTLEYSPLKRVSPPLLDSKTRFLLDKPLVYATNEELITFYRRMTQVFRSKQHASNMYGGQLWERIAENGEKLFREPITQGPDTIFSLEHNSGSLFKRLSNPDKFLTSTVESGKAMKQLLDTKRNCQGRYFSPLHEAIRSAVPEADLIQPEKLYDAFRAIVEKMDQLIVAYHPQRQRLFTREFISGS